MGYILNATVYDRPQYSYFLENFIEGGGLRWTSDSMSHKGQQLVLDTIGKARAAMNKVIMYAIRDEWVDRYNFNIIEIK